MAISNKSTSVGVTKPAVAVASKGAASPKLASGKAAAGKAVPVKASAVKKAIPKAPAKTVAGKSASATKTPAKTPAGRRAAPAKAPHLALPRTHDVEVAAFYIAERRGFAGGNPVEDWLAAEAEIDQLIASGHFSR